MCNKFIISLRHNILSITIYKAAESGPQELLGGTRNPRHQSSEVPTLRRVDKEMAKFILLQSRAVLWDMIFFIALHSFISSCSLVYYGLIVRNDSLKLRAILKNITVGFCFPGKFISCFLKNGRFWQSWYTIKLQECLLLRFLIDLLNYAAKTTSKRCHDIVFNQNDYQLVTHR